MLLTPHILIGVAIITKIQNPILGLILVLLSHYFLDLFPQQEYSIENMRKRHWRKSLPDILKVFLDITLGFFIVFLIVNYNSLILIAALLTIAPDGSTLLYFIFPENKLLKKHQELHRVINALCENKKIPAFWGVFSQIAVIAIAIWFLL